MSAERSGVPLADSASVAMHVHDVHKSYRHANVEVHALRGATLSVPRGRLVALKGRSGAGKSTLLNLIAGLHRADHGHIFVDGRDITAASDNDLIRLRRDTVGVIYQDFALLPLLTAEENVGVPLRITRTAPVERDARVAELLERMGLSKHAKQRPDELSGGEQQRVAVARALANQPRMLLADEPTAQLDSETGARIMTLLHELVQERGMTALVATHDPMLQRIADSVLHLTDGVVTETAMVA